MLKPFIKYPPPPFHSPLFHLLVFPILHFTLLQFLTILLFLSFPAFPSFLPLLLPFMALLRRGERKISQILFCAAIPFWPLFFPGTRPDRSFICENTKELAKGASLTFIQWMGHLAPSPPAWHKKRMCRNLRLLQDGFAIQNVCRLHLAHYSL